MKRFYLILLLLSPLTFADQYHVDTTGVSGSAGGIATPWSLQYALDSAQTVDSVLVAGDTIWVHGGNYVSTGDWDGGENNIKFRAKLQGTVAYPILVRNFNDERVTLSAGNNYLGVCLFVHDSCRYTWFWGLELAESNVINRIDGSDGSDLPDVDMGSGIKSSGSEGTGESKGIKFINMVWHDILYQFFSADLIDAEIYGCLAYNVGAITSARRTGYPIYMQNRNGTKTVKHNVFVNNYSYNIHAYGSSSAYLDSITVDGNIVRTGEAGNILLGGGQHFSYGQVVQNTIFWRNWTPLFGGGINLGYSNKHPYGAIVKHNWLFGPAAPIGFSNDTLCVVDSNTIYSWTDYDPNRDDPEWDSLYPNNTILQSNNQPTTGDTIFIIPNQYESDRCNIAIVNFSGADSVSVDVSSVYNDGDTVLIYNTQNYFGDAAYESVVTNDSLLIPMDSVRWTQAIPSGESVPLNASSFPYWGAFIGVLKVTEPALPEIPVVITDPTSGTTIRDGTRVFSVSAINGPPNYQWQKNSVNISGATSSSYTATAVWPTNHGATFRCIVTNAAGSDTSAAAVLSILLRERGFKIR